MKRTKIVATVGPASESPKILAELIGEGANVFRFNLKHNTLKWHKDTIEMARKISAQMGTNIGIMIDIPRGDYDTSLIDDYDLVALSYVKTSDEIDKIRDIYSKKRKNIKIVAKIENRKAVENLDKIILKSDGIMVARGDLGEAVSFKELAYYQKLIIKECRNQLKPVIVATEMLLSMTNNKIPTRTEATDVANAIYDETDAVMLSQETATGNYPQLCVKTMSEIVKFAEKTVEKKRFRPKIDFINDQLFFAAAEIVGREEGNIKAILVMTKSGRSSFKIASFRPNIPIYAISDNQNVLNGLTFGYGIVPFLATEENTNHIFETLINKKLLKKGDNVLLVYGQNWLETGSTNTISLLTV